MGKFRPITENGYSLFDAASSLQKSIRRGMEEEAMYWAAELETKYHKYLWRRLQIISIEDVGLASHLTVLYVAEMRTLYDELHRECEGGKKGRSFRMALGNAVLALCRAPKCRIGDDFQIVIYGRRVNGWRLDVPDFAYDMHTARGREIGRGPEHFWTESIQLENPSPDVDNPYTPEARELRVNPPPDPEPPESESSGKSPGTLF